MPTEHIPAFDESRPRKGGVLFREYGTHKAIYPGYPWGSGYIKISDQETIDALREAFEKAGWEIEDVVC